MLPSVRTINAPHLAAPPAASQAAVFWFGTVSPATTYSDARVAYTDTEVYPGQSHLNSERIAIGYRAASPYFPTAIAPAGCVSHPPS
jgi:hypothetical protein